MRDRVEVVSSEWYRDEAAVLSPDERDRVNLKLRDLRRKGWAPSVADQSIKHLRDGIYELRVLGRGASYRVLCFVVPGHSPRVIVLTSCVAKSMMKKRPRMDAAIERARNRRAMWIERQKERGADGR